MPSGNNDKTSKFRKGTSRSWSGNTFLDKLNDISKRGSSATLKTFGDVVGAILPEPVLKASTFLSPLNYLAALSHGTLDPRVGELEIATWDPRLQLLGRVGEIATGPKVVKATGKGIKGASNLAVDVAAQYGNKTARSLFLSRELNKNIRNTTINPEVLGYNTFRDNMSQLSGDNYYHGGTSGHNVIGRLMFGGNNVFLSYGKPWKERLSSTQIEIPAELLGDLPLTNKYGVKTGYQVKDIYNLMMHLSPQTAPKNIIYNIKDGANLTTANVKKLNNFLLNGDYVVYNSPSVFNPYGSIERYYGQLPQVLKFPDLPTSLKFFERRPSRITKSERAGVSKGDRNLPKHIRYPKVNWDPDNWFIKISKRDSYFPEEAEELASNVPEYEIIEKKLFNEGKLTTDSKGNVIVKGSRMTPQEYIMRLSKAFLKMNPEHHYTGVKKEYVNDFENISNKRPYDIWTDKLSPRNVEEYAYSGLSGNTIYSDIDLAITSLRDIKSGGLAKDFDSELLFSKKLLDEKVIGKDEYLQKIESTNAARDNLMKQAVDNLVKLLLKRKTDPLNGGKIYDVTYPKQTVETPIFDVHGAKWSNILKDDITSKDSRYFTNSSADRVMTDEIVEEGRPLGVGVTHIDNVMDSSNGTLLNEAIIDGSVTPVKSVLGNTGKFDTSGINKWKLFRSVTPFIGGYTLYNLNKTHNNYE